MFRCALRDPVVRGFFDRCGRKDNGRTKEKERQNQRY